MAFIATLTLLLSLTTFCLADCPDGFVKHAGSCYHIVRIKATWPESDIYCHAVGSDLVTIETQAEQHFLAGLLAATAGAYNPPQFWIGGNDIAEEGNWLWLKSKTPIGDQDYANWIDGNVLPVTADENCLMITQSGHWQWEDNNCDDHYFFVCEKDAYQNGGIIIG